MTKPLQFEYLSLEKFGPFLEKQEIHFPPEGVAIVYGDNGCGKTFLTRAIHFALYGSIGDRRHSNQFIPTGKLVHLDALQNQESASVTLTFSCRGNKYQIVREIHPQAEFNGDAEDLPCKVTLHFFKNGEALKFGEVESEINQILPQEISRFFIFDGEQMQEYRDLLTYEAQGQQRIIAHSIERILGIPHLRNAAKDTEYLESAVSSQISSVENTDREIGQNQESLRRITEDIKEVEEQKQYWMDIKEKAEEEEERIKVRLNEHQKAQALIGKIESKDIEMGNNEKDIKETEDESQLLRNDLWKGVLGEVLKPFVEFLRDKEKQSIQESMRKVRINLIDSSINKKRCELCDTRLSQEMRDRMQEELNSISSGKEDEHTVFLSIDQIQRQIQVINNFTEHKSTLKRVLDLNKRINGLKIRNERLRREREDLKDQIGGSDIEINIKKLVNQMTQEESARGNAEETLKKIEDSLNELRKAKDRIMDNINRLGKKNGTGEEMANLFLKHKTCVFLHKTFSEAIEQFRTNLKKQVEETASRFFVKMIEDKSVKSLRINDSFGLEMVRWDNVIVPLPSDAQFHITSLALIGALHRNAPLEGPLVMDAPVIRLDDLHVASFFDALSELSDQVLLLATPRDLPVEKVGEGLGDKLKMEYKLVRIFRGDSSESQKGSTRIDLVS